MSYAAFYGVSIQEHALQNSVRHELLLRDNILYDILFDKKNKNWKVLPTLSCMCTNQRVVGSLCICLADKNIITFINSLGHLQENGTS